MLLPANGSHVKLVFWELRKDPLSSLLFIQAMSHTVQQTHMVAPRAWQKGILVSEDHRKWTQSWRWQKGRWGHTGSSTEWAELQSPAVTRREQSEMETSRLQSLPSWCSLTILHEQGAGGTYWLHCSGQSKGRGLSRPLCCPRGRDNTTGAMQRWKKKSQNGV